MATVVITHTHDHAMMAHHYDGQAVADHHHDQASPSSDGAKSDPQHTHKSSYCSACAACCFGAVAPPPAMSWKPKLGFHLADALPSLDQFVGHIPARLERPPRHLSA